MLYKAIAKPSILFAASRSRLKTLNKFQLLLQTTKIIRIL